MLEDAKIIELFFARTEQAIKELSVKYGRTCKRIAKNILKSESDAEECVNDTYLATWNTIPPEKPNPLRSYVFRITRNIAIAKYHSNTAGKRNSFYDVALDELEECLTSSMTVEQEVNAKELSREINRLVCASLLPALSQWGCLAKMLKPLLCTTAPQFPSARQM